MRRLGSKKTQQRKTTPEEGLLIAAVRGDVAALRQALDSGVDINTRQKDGSSPILRACAMGNEDAVRLLIARGALLDAADSRGRTPLHASASRGYIGVVRQLLGGGCDPGIKDANGKLAHDLVEVSACPTRAPECGNAACELHSAKAKIKELLGEFI